MNIVEQFMESKYKKILFNYDEVAGIILSGSRSVNVNIDDSDYDIGVFVVNKKSLPDFNFVILNDKNEKLHWYYNNINEIIDDEIPYNHITQLFLVELNSFTKDKFLYINPKYESLIDKLLANKQVIAHRAAQRYLCNETNYNNIKKIAERDTIKYADYTKLLFRFAFIHFFLFDGDPEFVKRVHRISTNPFTKEESDRMIKICKDLIQYADARRAQQ